MMQSRTRAALVALLLLAATCAPTLAQPAPPMPPNPFAGFESFRLGNGLRVWYGHMPGAGITSMAVIAPAGFDDDPPGQEQTAHLLEHVLLSDRAGATEAALVRDLTSRGGSYRAATYADRTVYNLNIGAADTPYGVQWLYSVVQPRPIPDALVERNRTPAAIEIGARPRRLHDWLFAWYVNNPALRPPGFWRREFGLATPLDRDVDPWRSLRALRGHHLQQFYERHYTPPEMTLVVVGGMPRAAVQQVLNETFGVMPWRPAPRDSTPLHVRTAETRRFAWRAGRNASVQLSWRLPELDGRDQLRALFVAGLLERRLTERLRSGDAKVVYGIRAGVSTRGPAALLFVTAEVDPRNERAVRTAIEDEVARLAGAVRDTAFYRDRDALAREVRIAFASPDALRNLVADHFHRTDMHAEFPDFGAYVSSAGADSIGAWAGRTFTRDRRILAVSRPLPLSPVWLLFLAALTCAAAVRLYRDRFLVPAEMSTIRYVARLRPPLRWLLVAATTLAALLALRLALAAAHFAAEYWLLAVDFPPLHLAAAAVLLALVTFATLLLVGRFHSKVLVFERAVWLKSPTYRATRIPGEHVAGAHLLAGDGARDLRPRNAFAGAGGTPVVLRLTDGTAWLLHVRRPRELLAALLRLIRTVERSAGAPATAPAGEPAAADGSTSTSIG